MISNVSTVTWYLDPSDLPDDEETVLICLASGVVWTGFRDAGEWREVDGAPITERVRCWARFPLPPEE
ncbi:MAG: hypothetical protein AB7J34_26215 [Limisphaerales bacterium]